MISEIMPERKIAWYEKSPWKEIIATLASMAIMSLFQSVFGMSVWLLIPVIAVLLVCITLGHIKNRIKQRIEYSRKLKEARRTVSLIHEACKRMENFIRSGYSRSLMSLVETLKDQNYMRNLRWRLGELDQQRQIIMLISDYFLRYPPKELKIVDSLKKYLDHIFIQLNRLVKEFDNAEKNVNTCKPREEDHRSFVRDFVSFIQWYKENLFIWEEYTPKPTLC